MTRVMLGLGCDRGTPLETVRTAIEQALAQAGLEAADVAGAATIDKKNDEACLLELARLNRWPLRFFSAGQLAAVVVPSPSEVVRQHMGTPSVSEAAALLAANTGMENLILEKLKHRGPDGKNATVSIARIPHE